jgi:hypothetical protein
VFDERGPRDTRLLPPAPAEPAAPFVYRPPLLPYRDDLPIPPGYHVETHANSGLVIGGSVLWGIGYVTGLLVASGDDFGNGTSWLAVPLIGPWAAIGARSFACSAATVETTKKCVDRAFDEVETITFMTVDGLVQATAVGLVIAGLASRKSELVRNDLKLGGLELEDVGFDVSPRHERLELGLHGRF